MAYQLATRHSIVCITRIGFFRNLINIISGQFEACRKVT